MTSPFAKSTTNDMAYASRKDSNGNNRLLSLPTEVRHKIYNYLYCKISGPLWLASHYQLFQPLYSVTFPVPRPDPTFETQLFRCCKDLHEDAVSFAYAANKFELRGGDLTVFCGLSQTALSSIRTLIVLQGPWKSAVQEDRTWALIQKCCSGLEHLEVVLQQDNLLASIPFLGSFQDDQTPREQKPLLALDVYVWDRHFSFDPLSRDLAWSEDVIRRSVKKAGADSMARTRILGLPRQARHIVLTADVTAGAVQALDTYFASLHIKRFIKISKAPPQYGPRAGGRGTRFWYEWQ